MEEVVTKPIEKIVAIFPVTAEFWEGLTEIQQESLLQGMAMDAARAFEKQAVITSQIKYEVRTQPELDGVYLPAWECADEHGNERVAPRMVSVLFSAYGYRKDNA
ncbi:hypothetical protein PBI_RUOTULA_46 [Mycobacterium phage Ruotula]|nr:hypothetical protein PBI_RUOTULA_46 [Mycobacterium phage Ruotula]